VNFFVVARSLGMMVLLLGVTMVGAVVLSAVVPAGASHETGLDLQGWAISLGIALLLGISFLLVASRLAKENKRGDLMRRREAMAVVGVDQSRSGFAVFVLRTKGSAAFGNLRGDLRTDDDGGDDFC
jgi:hypothetical protein